MFTIMKNTALIAFRKYVIIFNMMFGQMRYHNWKIKKGIDSVCPAPCDLDQAHSDHSLLRKTYMFNMFSEIAGFEGIP